MVGFVARRFIIALPTLLGAYCLIFLMTRLVPGDPVRLMLEATSSSGDSYAVIQHQLGLDRPIWEQFAVSLGGLLHGDLGTSFQNRRPVSVNIVDQLPSTVQLALAAMLIAALIGLPAGVVAAIKHNRWQDYGAMVLSLLALCAPSFWLAILLLLFFSLRLGWLPSFGVGDDGDPGDLLAHLILPAITLGAGSAGLVARITRSSMLESLAQDYVRTARAKGLHERVVVTRHALRNALLPVVTLFGLEAVTLLAGTIITETVFGRRGIGKLLIDAVLTRDYPQIQALLLLFVGLALVVSILVDAAYGVVDPRIRYS